MKYWKRKIRPQCNYVLNHKKVEQSGKSSPLTGYLPPLSGYFFQFLSCAKWFCRPLFHTWDYVHLPSKYNSTEHLMHARLILDVGIKKKRGTHHMREERKTSESEKHNKTKC